MTKREQDYTLEDMELQGRDLEQVNGGAMNIIELPMANKDDLLGAQDGSSGGHDFLHVGMEQAVQQARETVGGGIYVDGLKPFM